MKRRSSSGRKRPIDVVYIAGTGRSGSTIIENRLAERLGAVSIGETLYFWSRGIRGDHLCECGKPFSECPFWSQLVARSDIAAGRGDELEALWEGQWHRLKAIPRTLAEGRRNRTLASAADAYEDLYEAAADVATRSTIVDSSKEPAFWLFLRLVGGVRLHTVHVVRDSRAVAFSWRRRVLKPELAHQRTEHMGIIPYWKTGIKWLVVNLVFLSFRGSLHSGKFVSLRYEDFARNPEATLARTLSELGLEASGDEAIHHSLSGNPVRFDPQRLARIRLDDEWKRAMPRSARAIVTLLGLPLLAALGYLRR